MIRYEFAASLNVCLQQIKPLISAQEGEISQQNLEILQRLRQEFETELASLSNQIDNLENRIGILEENQFSTTTKLSSFTSFVNPLPFGNDKTAPFGTEADNTDEVDNNIGFLWLSQVSFN